VRKRTIWSFVAAWFLVAAPAHACMPDVVLFPTGSTHLDEEELRAISQLATIFRHMPRGTIVRLTANMDGIGSTDANIRLARRRSEAVKAAFVRRGIPANAIDINAPFAGRGSFNGNARYVQIDLAERSCG
jgi:outer membrane protein OmpA-like peptidoglycan-associated protein